MGSIYVERLVEREKLGRVVGRVGGRVELDDGLLGDASEPFLRGRDGGQLRLSQRVVAMKERAHLHPTEPKSSLRRLSERENVPELNVVGVLESSPFVLCAVSRG